MRKRGKTSSTIRGRTTATELPLDCWTRPTSIPKSLAVIGTSINGTSRWVSSAALDRIVSCVVLHDGRDAERGLQREP